LEQQSAKLLAHLTTRASGLIGTTVHGAFPVETFMELDAAEKRLDAATGPARRDAAADLVMLVGMALADWAAAAEAGRPTRGVH
jgi:hypothetical protein